MTPEFVLLSLFQECSTQPFFDRLGQHHEKRGGSVVVLQPKGEIANLLSVQQPTIRLGSTVNSTRFCGFAG